MVQTKREQFWSHTLGIGRAELSQGETARLAYSTSASSHPYVDIPIGASLIGFYHDALSAGGSFKFRAAISASGTYRVIQKIDGSGDFSLVSGSAARVQRIEPGEMCRFIKATSNKAFGSRRVYGYVVKG